MITVVVVVVIINNIKIMPETHTSFSVGGIMHIIFQSPRKAGSSTGITETGEKLQKTTVKPRSRLRVRKRVESQ